MTESFKRCPICAGRNGHDASICSTCGANITDIEAQVQFEAGSQNLWRYEDRYGEADLYEGAARKAGRRISAGILVILFAIGIGFAMFSVYRQSAQSAPAEPTPTLMMSLPALSTVTTGPPTATWTPSPAPTLTPTVTSTPSPCIHRVAEGDSLISIITGCGHSSLDALPTVMAINGIIDETRIQIGQEIVVPLPTATIDTEATAQPVNESSARSEQDSPGGGVALLSFDPFAPTPRPTLLPGLMWHEVASGETMIAVAVNYDTTAKQLSDLNPEIDFALCDFGLPYGGGACIVNLNEGQRMRVPAPTNTVTPVPTLTGSETPTPTATATVNAPHAISPPDRRFFAAPEQITLRWVATGTLTADETFRVVVSEVGSGQHFTADTRDLYFILPPQWQEDDDQRHTYIWQISIVNTEKDTHLAATDIQTFVWMGAGDSHS